MTGQARGVAGATADRDRPRHVFVQQAECAAEQVDAGGDDRRPDVVVLEDQQLDQVVEVTLVVRDVDHAPGVERSVQVRQPLGHPFDLAQDRVERVLEGAIVESVISSAGQGAWMR